MCFLAPLGLQYTIRMYKVEDSTLDIFKTDEGVGRCLEWDHNETEIYVYASELPGGHLMPA